MGKSRHTKGFTLMEMIITVGVTVVLFALVIPNIVKLQHNLRIMQLNESAQQVYQATQFRLSQMQSAGQLSAYESDVESTGQVTKPRAAIYPVGDNDQDKAVYYLSSTHDTNNIISEGLFTQKTNPISKNIIGGNYIILLSPATAEVVAVYYWEQDCKIEDVLYKDVADLDEKSLNENNVGIYVGGDIRGEGAYDGDVDLNNFYFDVVNKEELYVRVMGKGIDQLPVTGAINKDNLAIKVNVYKPSDTGNALWSDSYLLKDLGFTDTSKEIDVVLDSMQKDQSILDKLTYDSKLSILPGDNIKVGVEIGIKNQDEAFKSEKVLNAQKDTGSKNANFIETNALFADVDRYDNTNVKNVDVRYLRHLNNLRYLNGEAILTNSGYRYLYNPFDVTIKQDIDFDGRNWDKNLSDDEPSCVSVLGKFDKDGNKLDNLNPLDEFKPIDLMYDNPYYVNYSPIKSVAGNFETEGEAQTGKLDSNKSDEDRIITLKNFKIEDKDDDGRDTDFVGLFSKSTADLSHISLENPSVKGRAEIGALVGQANFRSVYNGRNTCSYITNCHVVAKNNDEKATGEISGDGFVGGLVGRSRSVVFNKVSVDLDNITGSDTSTSIGGICGEATFDHAIFNVPWDIYDAQVIIHNISGRDRIGGICGRANSANLWSCIAGSNNGDELSVSGDFLIGGLVGEALDSKIGSSKVYLDTIAATGKNSEEKNNVSYIGGICGDCSPISGGKDNAAYNKSDISSVEVNFNEIRGTDRVGGIAGRANGGVIQNFTINGGVIKGNFVVGGVAGESYLGKINNGTINHIDSVSGLLDTSGYIGGVFGDSTGQTVNNVIANVDTISGNNHVGGFTGRANKLVCNSCKVNCSSIEGSYYVGGFSGLSIVSNYYNDTARSTSITGKTNIGGFVGYDGMDNKSSVFNGCRANTNSLSGQEHIGGFVGYALNNAGNKQHFLNHNSNNYYYYWVNENTGYFANCSVKLGSITGNKLCGGFAGESFFNWFKDCNVQFKNIRGSGIAVSDSYAGGFCGKQYESAEEDCKVINKTDCTIQGPYYVGGFIGYILTENANFVGNGYEGSGGVQNCELAVGGTSPFNVIATDFKVLYASHVGGGFIGAMAKIQLGSSAPSSACVVANNRAGNSQRAVQLYEDRLATVGGPAQANGTGTYPLIGYGPTTLAQLTSWYDQEQVFIEPSEYNR